MAALAPLPTLFYCRGSSLPSQAPLSSVLGLAVQGWMAICSSRYGPHGSVRQSLCPPLYLVPAHLAAGQELGLEQHGSWAWGLLAVGTQVEV